MREEPRKEALTARPARDAFSKQGRCLSGALLAQSTHSFRHARRMGGLSETQPLPIAGYVAYANAAFRQFESPLRTSGQVRVNARMGSVR